jgi:hypothetical protein
MNQSKVRDPMSPEGVAVASRVSGGMEMWKILIDINPERVVGLPLQGGFVHLAKLFWAFSVLARLFSFPWLATAR